MHRSNVDAADIYIPIHIFDLPTVGEKQPSGRKINISQ